MRLQRNVPMILSSFWLISGLLAAGPSAAASEQNPWIERRGKRLNKVQMPSLAPIVSEVEDAVLSIYTRSSRGPKALPPGHPKTHGGDGFQVEGEGSGFLIHPDGYALTNYHVIENVEEIRVQVGQARAKVNAEVVGIDPLTDVALLKLAERQKPWPYIPLGDSEKLKVGDFVIAIGNPFGLTQSVSLGVVSARGRKSINPSRRIGLYDFLQTDASINPGNSGGPLLNLQGEVIGMNTAINVSAQGIGFAIPVNMMKGILPSLRTNGRVLRAWLGVSIQRIRPELSDALGIADGNGALVRMVKPAGPAGRAGLQPGDVITRFGNEHIHNAEDLPLLAGAGRIGEIVQLTFVRDQQTLTADVTLGAHPGNLPASGEQGDGAERGEEGEKPAPTFGITIMELNPDIRKRLSLSEQENGIVLHKVKPHSPAAKAGLKSDDLILKINGRQVESLSSFQTTLQSFERGAAIRFLIRRGNQTLFLAMLAP